MYISVLHWNRSKNDYVCSNTAIDGSFSACCIIGSPNNRRAAPAGANSLCTLANEIINKRGGSFPQRNSHQTTINSTG